MTEKKIRLTLSQKEFDTVIASLRLWQRSAAHIADQHGTIADIAEEHGDALTFTEIDDLIERIN
jgi:hypothetical protein